MCDDSPRARSPEPGPGRPSLGAAEGEAHGRDVAEGSVTSLCPGRHRHVGDPHAELGRHPPGTRTLPLLPSGAGNPVGPAWGAPCGSRSVVRCSKCIFNLGHFNLRRVYQDVTPWEMAEHLYNQELPLLPQRSSPSVPWPGRDIFARLRNGHSLPATLAAVTFPQRECSESL